MENSEPLHASTKRPYMVNFSFFFNHFISFFSYFYVFLFMVFHFLVLFIVVSKLYGVNATIILFIFVFYCIVHIAKVL